MRFLILSLNTLLVTKGEFSGSSRCFVVSSVTVLIILGISLLNDSWIREDISDLIESIVLDCSSIVFSSVPVSDFTASVTN